MKGRGNQNLRNTSAERGSCAGRRLALAAGLAWAASGASVDAGTFGVPTNLTTAGQTQASSANPTGWFLLAGLNSPPINGDTTHQIRLFIEVTGTTLDVRVFDPGTSGARDGDDDDTLRTTFQLLNPCTPFPTCAGTVRSQVANMDDDTSSTQNRLARFTPNNNGFFALNSNNGNNVPFTGLTPGLYEFRIFTTTNGADVNFFGVDIRNQAGANYAVYTIGRTASQDSSMVVGAHNSGGSSPEANITQPMAFYGYVDRGCTMQTTNFDMDVNGSPGNGANGSILDVLGVSTTLTMSDEGDNTGSGPAHAENVIGVEPLLGVNTESTNYGMYRILNHTGSQQNWIQWRTADWQGFSDNPNNDAPNPLNPVRIYMPNRSGIGSGATETAPTEPVLRTSLQFLGGPNPPSPSGTTRFALYGHIDNLTTLSVTNALVSIGVPAPAAIDTTSLTAYLDGVATTCSSQSISTSLVQCRFATVPTNQTATIRFEVTLQPPGAGVFLLTGPPAVGTPTPDTSARGSYSSAFGTTESVGPVCELRVNTTTIITRATLRGVRVDPNGVVEFATATQRGTLGFDVFGTDDPHARGARVKLNDAPILAPVPDSQTPILYRAQTRPITTRYLVIEEIERGGRRHALGPVPVGDPRLRVAFERVEQRLDQAGAQPTAGRSDARMTPGRMANGLVASKGTGGERRRPLPAPAHFGQGVKIEVAEAGLVRVPLADLRANGLPPGVALDKLRLTNQGQPVPFKFDKDENGRALLFESQPLSTAYTGVNVYVLTWTAKVPGMKAGLTNWGYAPLPGFRRVDRNTFFVPSAPQGDDPWLWDLLFGDGTPWPYDYDPDLGDFDLPGLSPDSVGPVAVRIRFAGVSAHQHTVEANINGVPVGSVSFVGSGAGILNGEVPAEALLETGNRLQLVYSAPGDDPNDLGLVYLNYLELELPEPPLAEISPLEVSPYNPNLVAGSRAADYLILTHPDFEEQAERIAGLKAAAGFHPVVAPVARAYDRYSGGIVEANAIRALLTELKRVGVLRYALLLGDDSFDPQDFMGMGLVSYVPSLYAWDDNFGRVPSENLYADVDGDASPDLAIGRLPAQTEEQAAAMAEKIARQSEVLKGEAGKHLFGVDNDTTPVSFRALANAVAASLPPGSQVTWADSGEDLDAARAILLAGLSQGSLVTHVFGHAGPEQWTDEALATVEDIEGLNGTPGEGVVLQWTCESQWYQYPLGSTMGEALLLVPQGGALASFGPAGISDAELQAPFYQKLYAQMFKPGVTLGEAVRLAKRASLLGNPRTRSIVEGWNLLGDPALRLDGGK
jgi:hypothetical protein